jgi:hypothetical protein
MSTKPGNQGARIAVAVVCLLLGCCPGCERDDAAATSPPPLAQDRNATFYAELLGVIMVPQTSSYGVLAERIRLVDASGVTDPLLLELQADFYQFCRLCDQQGWTLQDGAFSVSGAIVGVLDPDGTYYRVTAVQELTQRIEAKAMILGPRYFGGGNP